MTPHGPREGRAGVTGAHYGRARGRLTEDVEAPGRKEIFPEQPRKNKKIPRIGFEARGPPGNPGNPYEPAVNPGRGNIRYNASPSLPVAQ